jgi:hypothetical protein
MSNEAGKMTWMDIVTESLSRKDNGVNFVKLTFERLPEAPERIEFETEEEFQKVFGLWNRYSEQLIRQAKHVDVQMAEYDAAEIAKSDSD